jgi:hypothetical protein
VAALEASGGCSILPTLTKLHRSDKVDRVALINEHYIRVKQQDYTTLVIRQGSLYERYYPTFDRPDYTKLVDTLSVEELELLASLGIT